MVKYGNSFTWPCMSGALFCRHTKASSSFDPAISMIAIPHRFVIPISRCTATAATRAAQCVFVWCSTAASQGLHCRGARSCCYVICQGRQRRRPRHRPAFPVQIGGLPFSLTFGSRHSWCRITFNSPPDRTHIVNIT